eukprot:15461082-Alexandrium_andersonii.AAC.1
MISSVSAPSHSRRPSRSSHLRPGPKAPARGRGRGRPRGSAALREVQSPKVFGHFACGPAGIFSRLACEERWCRKGGEA